MLLLFGMLKASRACPDNASEPAAIALAARREPVQAAGELSHEHSVGTETNALPSIDYSYVAVRVFPVRYDNKKLAVEMKAEGLPAEFIETITTGWWTTCLEVLPHKERALGRF